MTPEDDADLIAAEQLTQAWLDDNGYVGRRRAVDDPILDDLVSAEVAWHYGDGEAYLSALARALVGLARRGLDQAQAKAEIERMRVRVQLDAARIVAGMKGAIGLCGDPDGHAIEFYDVITWTQHRKRTGRCAQCSGLIPGGSR